MKAPAYLFASLLAATSLLGACSKKSSDTPAPGGGDYMDFTLDGKAYHSTLYASAIEDSDTSVIVTGSSDDLNTIVGMRLSQIWKHGAGVYQFKKGPMYSSGAGGDVTLGGKTANGQQFETTYGPAAINGSATVTKYDRAGQKVSGTFSFTAGAIPYGTGTGTHTVTNGSFSFTVFH